MRTNGKLRRAEATKPPPRAEKLNPDCASTKREFLLNALDQYQRPLTDYATRLLGGDLHSARDAVQHAFMQLCKQSPKTIEDKLAPWLYTVCRNRILDELKSRSRQTQVTPESFDPIDAQAFDPANQSELDDFLGRLRQLFNCLSNPERDVIELWSRGLDAAEISNVLKKNQGTVRVNLHRAINRLKQHPDIAKWLERATGQFVQPDVAQSPGPTSNCNEKSRASTTGERS